VTRGGEDKLLSTEENTAAVITPTQEEMDTAITKSIHNVMAVVSKHCLERYCDLLSNP
jgi:hypothetical protein